MNGRAGNANWNADSNNVYKWREVRNSKKLLVVKVNKQWIEAGMVIKCTNNQQTCPKSTSSSSLFRVTSGLADSFETQHVSTLLYCTGEKQNQYSSPERKYVSKLIHRRALSLSWNLQLQRPKLKNEMLRDRLIVGIKDAAHSQQLQLDPELTLE